MKKREERERKMQKLYKIEDLVKPFLELDPETRADDFLLVLNVYGAINISIIDPLFGATFYDVMKNHRKYKLPSFGSVTRCRRKLQELYPELRPIKDVEEARINETAEYIEYALD